MKRILLFLLIAILIQSCSPGIKVDSKLSDSYYYQPISFLIIYSPQGNWFELDYKIVSTAPWNFTVLSENIGKNKNTVFYKYHQQTNVDIESFSVIKNVIKDKNNVCTVSEDQLIPIPDADPKSFEYLKPSSTNTLEWSKDNKNYYFHDKKVPVDYNTFKIVNDQFFYDKDSIYTTFNNNIKSIDISYGLIDRINNNYSRNEKTLFYYGNQGGYKKTPIRDGEQIFVISDEVVRVGDKIIYEGSILLEKEVDSKTFQILSNNSSYFKDKNHIYYNNKILPEADVNTF